MMNEYRVDPSAGDIPEMDDMLGDDCMDYDDDLDWPDDDIDVD